MNFKASLVIILSLLMGIACQGHPMPATQLLMDVSEDDIHAELRLPLNELQLAVGNARDVSTHTESLAARDSAWLAAYVLSHMHPVSEDNVPWAIIIERMQVSKAAQDGTGSFDQLILKLQMQPPAGKSARDFLLYYDAIIHQVVTHKALVAIQHDWAGGHVHDDVTEVGVIAMDVQENAVSPLVVHLEEGGNWRGFRSMVLLGIGHIAGGTDHLLFLLALLLPASLIAAGGRWSASRSTRYAVLRVAKIATAFTIGHSLTLLAGALGWLHLPQRPVEVLIALSVLFSGIHAMRPVFPGRESIVAGSFGLVHGLAFATVLSELQLRGGRMALSILGFNIGIELMQLFVILLIMPWLLIMAGSRGYRIVRIAGAIAVCVAATVWIIERISNNNTKAGAALQQMAAHSKWIVLMLACCALLSYSASARKKKKATPYRLKLNFPQGVPLR
jgi:hypothetical protein